MVVATREHDWALGYWASAVRLIQVARGAGAKVLVIVLGEGSGDLPDGWQAYPDAAALLDLVERELRAAETAVSPPAMLVLTDDAGLAQRMAAPGCLPVVLEPVGGLWPAQDQYLSIDDARRLSPYFERPPAALLELLWTTAPEVLRHHELVSKRFADAMAGGGRVFVFGAGTVGRQVARIMRERGGPPVGFLDNDPATWRRVIDGLEVHGPTAVDPSRDLVMVAVGGHAADIEHQLDGLGVRHHFNLSELFYHLGLEPERDLAIELSGGVLQYQALFTLLADEDSRRTLNAVVRHRLTLDTAVLAAVCVHDFPQWFDASVVPERDDYILVDGGAYDGDTVASFAAAFSGHFARVYAFEPDAELASRTAERFKGDSRVRVYPCGLSNRSARAAFATTGATDGRLGGDAGARGAESGARRPHVPADYVMVDVASIDEVVHEPVGFIKLDVEGAELAALRGAARHIAADAPLLAVAVYHRAADIVEIPQHVLVQRGDYRLFLRHYTEVSFETVLYAIPSGGAAFG